MYVRCSVYYIKCSPGDRTSDIMSSDIDEPTRNGKKEEESVIGYGEVQVYLMQMKYCGKTSETKNK